MISYEIKEKIESEIIAEVDAICHWAKTVNEAWEDVAELQCEEICGNCVNCQKAEEIIQKVNFFTM